jgi:hypothetical protein
MAASPSTSNYQVGKGIVAFKGDGDSDFVDVGNVPSLTLEYNVTKLDHFTSRAGLKQKDKSVTVSIEGTMKMTMDEITARNLRVALLGSTSTDSDGNSIIKLGVASAVEGYIRFRGTNDIGLQLNFDAKVSITPDGAFNFISDEWNQINVSAELLSYTTYGGADALGEILVEDVAAIA